jgi:Immunoglobulin domain
MSTFGKIHFLRRQRRFALGEFPSPSIGCFEDFESQRLDYGGPERGWAGPGVVYTYAALVAFEDFETSTLTSTILPVFGWSASGTATAPSISSNPTTVAAPPGVTVSFTVVVINGVSPLAYQWRKNGSNLSNGGVVSGATTATLTLTGIGSGDLANYDCVVTDALSRSVTSTAAALTDLVVDWVARVVAAGGATPSGGTQSALTTFVSGLVTDGIYSSMKAVNCIVPDSLIAATVPLIQGIGNSPWTNNNFVSGDLTVNGFTGNASNKYLNTGINPSLFGLNLGFSVYASATPSAVASVDFGAFSGSAYAHMIARFNDGNSYAGNAGTSQPSAPTRNAGFYSSQRTNSTSHNLYFANSGTSLTSIASDATSSSGYPNLSMSLMAGNVSGSITYYSSNTLSFAAVTVGMNSTDTANLYARVQTLRTALGGGFV